MRKLRETLQKNSLHGVNELIICTYFKVVESEFVPSYFSTVFNSMRRLRASRKVILQRNNSGNLLFVFS